MKKDVFVKKAVDSGNDSYGFKEVLNVDNGYTYDVNGNMTKDLNKGITNISYNHLNLPTKIHFRNGGSIDYKYDARGVKLEKEAGGEYGDPSSTQYAGNYIYKKNPGRVAQLKLAFFNHPEGYVSPKNASDISQGVKYVYQYKDHLGNVRLSYTDNNNDGVITPSTEIIEESNYYPFGLKHKGYNNITNSLGNSVAQKFGYNGKELNEELGLQWHDFGARNYDASLGRWMNLDPLAEQMRRHSPYNYTFNNRIFFIDSDGMAPQDPRDLFTTKDAAAIDFGNYYNGVSILNYREYGASIYSVVVDGKTYYSYTEANKGSNAEVNSKTAVPKGTKRVGTTHTHGGYEKKYKNNVFSKADKRNSDRDRQVKYVSTPNGSVKKYNPKTKKVKTISQDIPSDPKDPDRKNNINPTESGSVKKSIKKINEAGGVLPKPKPPIPNDKRPIKT
ncbi:RHS repeat domain-containing protein [Tenacibaculum maritimum]|uniref:RHS repeat domain-containing protein n=1 Tax=Tenacibaculum maritimum TaxID=107401 RepID=UPI00132FD040|nr:DUF4329 domain-containing protein [Tenacibaculum maritimum]